MQRKYSMAKSDRVVPTFPLCASPLSRLLASSRRFIICQLGTTTL